MLDQLGTAILGAVEGRPPKGKIKDNKGTELGSSQGDIRGEVKGQDSGGG